MNELSFLRIYMNLIINVYFGDIFATKLFVRHKNPPAFRSASKARVENDVKLTFKATET